MFYNIRKYLVCIVLSRTFVYVKFKKQIVMTKFIDNTKKANSKKTVFEKFNVMLETEVIILKNSRD